MTETAGRTETIDFDPFDRAHRADPYPWLRRLRERAPVYRNPLGHWLISRHRDVVGVFRDKRFGHGTHLLQRNTFRRPVAGRSRPFIMLDPPEHTRLRSLVNKAFTPRMIDGLEPRIARIVSDLLDEAEQRNDVDLMDAFAYSVPVMVISELLGVPRADMESVKDLSHIVARGVDPDFHHTPEEMKVRANAFARFDDYFRGLLEERRQRPQDDLLSGLAAVRESGSALTEAELLTTCILLYVAGHETTMDLIGNGALALMRFPRERDRLAARPELARGAVEELLRFDPPTQLTRRTALEDVELDGHHIRQGDQVVLMRGAANRDPEAFDRPDELDLGRTDNKHVSFDGGIHFCLGAPLARLEGRIAFTELLRRAPRMRLTVAEDDLEYRDNLVIRGLATLPVRLRP
ncbi:cytochrome P450 [Actinoplanes sp. NPDC051346]|uniref:cytochrome P450 n=1 Tax=Actinoplanes sp. NPDC051346 TaxID=3155048 RepID=UPI003432A7CB